MANITLKVKSKSGQQILNSLTKDSTIKDLKQILSSISSIPVNRLQVLSGFPPKTLDISKDDRSLGSSGLSSGDTLILQEASAPPVEEQIVNAVNSVIEERTATLPNRTDDLGASQGILIKQIVPADNSCLFTSFGFVLNGKIDETGETARYMRQLVAQTIRNDKINYDAAILGKPIDEYCSWIQNDTSWGGAIELAILSNHYGIEIAVVNTVNAIVNRFGEDQNYSHRVFLMFDGIHYDPVYLEPFNGGKIQTLFQTTEENILRDAQTLAHEAKSSRQFTDVNKFTLKCMICNVFLKGQAEVQAHAKSTSHNNFGEV